MELQELKKELPYKWRVQSANQYGATCVAYIDARYVQDILDEVCGQENWQVKYEEHKGNLFAHIGIRINNDWVWKSDCGTESQVEKEKGEASDAFKRAGVMWGIGRFLYSKKVIKLPVAQNQSQKWVPSKDGKFITNPTDITNWCEYLINLEKPQQPKAEPKIDVARLETRLSACTTIEELEKVFKSLTPAEQKAVATFTTNLKNALTKQSA